MSLLKLIYLAQWMLSTKRKQGPSAGPLLTLCQYGPAALIRHLSGILCLHLNDGSL